MELESVRPLGNRILAVQDEGPTQTKTGILIPPTAKEETRTAHVLEVGPDAKQVKKGDHIMFSESDYKLLDRMKFEGKEVLIIKEEAVIAILQ